MRLLQFIGTVLGGLTIAALSYLAAQLMPQFGWGFGWRGCWLAAASALQWRYE